MQCDLCRIREAIIHMTKMTGERKTVRIDLCLDCADANQIDDTSGNRLEDLLAKIRAKVGEPR